MSKRKKTYKTKAYNTGLTVIAFAAIAALCFLFCRPVHAQFVPCVYPRTCG